MPFGSKVDPFGHVGSPAAVVALAARSFLLPATALFYPSGSPKGRSKHHRWADDVGSEDSDDDHPVGTYLDVVRRPTKPQAHSIEVSGCYGAGGGQLRLERRQGGATTRRQGPMRRRRKHSWPRPQLVRGLPHWPMDGRVPACHRLGHRGQVSTPNADGWWEILPRQEARPAAASVEDRQGQTQLSHIQKIPAEPHDRCFNCLSYSH